MNPKPTTTPTPEALGTIAQGLGLPVGSSAPDASVQDDKGRAASLRAYVGKQPLVLVFYRGGWCPFCNFQIRELALSFREFARRGVSVVAVSVDRVDEAAKTAALYSVPFPLLSDPDLAAHRAYRVLHHVDEAERTRLKGYGMDIEAASGRMHHDIAVPSVFVIDAAGVIRWAHVDPSYKARPSVAQLLDVIDRNPRP